MNRRQVVIFGLAAALSGPAFASGFEDDIVAALRAQGYDQITVEVTFLGRVRITAMRQSNMREIVINPRTGEILRDLWLTPDGRVAKNGSEFDDLDQDDDRSDDSGSGNDGSDDGDSDSSGSGNSGSNSDDSDSDDSSNDHSNDDESDSGDSDGDSGRDSGGERD